MSFPSFRAGRPTAACFRAKSRGYETDEDTGVVTILSDDEGTGSDSDAVPGPAQNGRTSTSSAKSTLVSPPRFHIRAESAAQDVPPRGSGLPNSNSTTKKRGASRDDDSTVSKKRGKTALVRAASAASTASPLLALASSFGRYSVHFPVEFKPGCNCEHCLGRKDSAYSIHHAETKSEYKYLLLSSRKDGSKKLFVETFPYSAKNVRTGEIFQFPRAWIQVDELISKWILCPPWPCRRKGVHLAWTYGGIFCGSHFAIRMLFSAENMAECEFRLGHGLNLMHLPELRYITNGECVNIADPVLQRSVYQAVRFVCFLHGEPLNHTRGVVFDEINAL